MGVISSALALKETHDASKEDLMSSVEKETVETPMDNYDKSIIFFRGAVWGFILCIPFWGLLFWFIF